jgi:hypothetical protein
MDRDTFNAASAGDYDAIATAMRDWADQLTELFGYSRDNNTTEDMIVEMELLANCLAPREKD